MKIINHLFMLMLALAMGQVNPLSAQKQEELSGSYKAMFFCVKKEGMSDADFRDWVLNKHVPMVKQFPKVRGYVQNFVLEKPEEVPYDLIVELWFDNAEDMAAAYETEIGKAAVADVENGLAGFPPSIAVHEVPITDAPMYKGEKQPGFKAIWLAEIKRGWDYQEYIVAHLMHYSPVAKRVPGMKGYFMNFLRNPQQEQPVATLVAETWFDSKEGAMTGLSNKNIVAQLKPKRDKLLATDPIMIVVEEHVLLAPPNYRSESLK